MRTLHCRITGLVQGVGFRYFTLQRARLLGVTGYVSNTYTGDVEVVAQGDESALSELLRDLRIGPRSAQVRGVRTDWTDDDNVYNSFDIRL